MYIGLLFYNLIFFYCGVTILDVKSVVKGSNVLHENARYEKMKDKHQNILPQQVFLFYQDLYQI